MKKLKNGAGRKLLLTNTPCKLKDDCLEYEACVYLDMAHNIFQLYRDITETIMFGETAGISQFCELEWYAWVEFCSTTISFPWDPLVLRKYLGPSIDIGPTMTAKILIPTGKVVHCSTYKLIMHEELADPVKLDHMKAFLWMAHDLGHADNLMRLASSKSWNHSLIWMKERQTRLFSPSKKRLPQRQGMSISRPQSCYHMVAHFPET